MRWVAAGRIWMTAPMSNDASPDQDLNDFFPVAANIHLQYFGNSLNFIS